MAARAGRPFKELLFLDKDTRDQSRLQAGERAENVRGAFSARPDETAAGMQVVLVDDVFTTGGTVNECSKALLAAGINSVKVATIARSAYFV